MKVVIERIALLPTGTLGTLETSSGFRCFTIERPWQDNEPNVSCIPDGSYECLPFSGKRFKNVVQVMNVPDRSYILFHGANRPSDVQGCIGPGVSFGFEGVTPRVNSSQAALRSLLSEGTSFDLTIRSKQCLSISA